MARKLSVDERDEQILQDSEAGSSDEEIAVKYQLTDKAVKHILQKMRTSDRREQIIQYIRANKETLSGKTTIEVCRIIEAETDIPYDIVLKMIRQMQGNRSGVEKTNVKPYEGLIRNLAKEGKSPKGILDYLSGTETGISLEQIEQIIAMLILDRRRELGIRFGKGMTLIDGQEYIKRNSLEKLISPGDVVEIYNGVAQEKKGANLKRGIEIGMGE